MRHAAKQRGRLVTPAAWVGGAVLSALPASGAYALGPAVASAPFHREGQPALVIRTQANAGFAVITDPATGIRLSLPMAIVNGPFGQNWGSNWKAADGRLNVDTLNFRGQRSLGSVFTKLRTVKGRRIANASNDGSQFILQGTDPDGTYFFVQCVSRSGEVRGISIVYSMWARSEMEPVTAAIIHSLELFPAQAPLPAYSPPPVAQAPAPAEPRDNPEIAKLQEQLETLKAKMKEQEEEARRSEEEKRLKEREDELRRQEREKAKEEAEKVEKKLLDELDRRFEEQRREARRAAPPATVGEAREIGVLPPGRRVAFVVGINDYKDLPEQNQLKRAVGDAKLMRATFEKLGFEIIPVPDNVTRRAFAQAWQAYLQAIEPGSTAAFFFAGHGVQMQGVNYLLPSDVPEIRVDSPELLQLEALSFTQLYSDVLARKPKVSLLVLDACRNNPFAQRYGRSVGATRGLTTVKPVEGSFVLYSANADEEALDRLPDDPPNEENSIFTRTLAPVLLTPDVTLQDAVRRVRASVAELARTAGHKQWPSYYDGLTGNVFLAGVTERAKTASGKAP